MIKKMILMLLVLVGGVMSANAYKLYVRIDPSANNWFDENAKTVIHMWGKTTSDAELTRENIYGNAWLSCELNGNTAGDLFRRDPNQSGNNYYDGNSWNQVGVSSLSTTADNYKEIYLDGSTFKIRDTSARLVWNYLTIRGNFASGLWNENNSNMTKDGDKFTYELSKATIDAYNSENNNVLTNDGIWFRFHHGDKVLYDDFGTRKDGEVYPEIAPQVSGSTGVAASLATNITSYWQDKDANPYWIIPVPTFNYEKLVFTADYSTHKWVIRVDCYVSPSQTKEYGTFSVAAPLDFANATGVEAYYASAANGTTVKMTKLTGAVAASEGLLLKKTGTTISIPVTTTVDGLSKNYLKPGVGGTTPVVSDNSYSRYVLATQNNVQNFYKLSGDGSIVPVGKAYLELPASGGTDALAPSLSIEIDGETTGIKVINVDEIESNTNNGLIYDLQGRRVENMTKGLYIVNGKKVVVK